MNILPKESKYKPTLTGALPRRIVTPKQNNYNINDVWINSKYFHYLSCILILCIFYYLNYKTAACYWDFPFEESAKVQYWQEYPYNNENNVISQIMNEMSIV